MNIKPGTVLFDTEEREACLIISKYLLHHDGWYVHWESGWTGAIIISEYSDNLIEVKDTKHLLALKLKYGI